MVAKYVKINILPYSDLSLPALTLLDSRPNTLRQALKFILMTLKMCSCR